MLAGLTMAAPASAQVLNFRQYTSTEGLPQAQILALHQDSQHYLWVGTYAGLSRYNGAEFRTYARADGLASNAVTTIVEDAAGRLHVGAIGGGVCTLTEGVATCIGTKQGLPHDDVLHILVDGDSSLWVATQRGIAHIAGGVVKAYGIEDGVPAAPVHRIVRDRAGVMWIAGDAGVARWTGNRFTPVFTQELGGAAVHVLAETQWGLLVGAGSRLFMMADGELSEMRLPDLPSRALITDAAVDASGHVWITTRAGVLYYDGETFERYTTGSGLLFDQATRVLVDREGNVWFGTERGLSRLTPGPFRHYTQRDGLPNPFVRAITADSRGRIWLGTRDGVAVREGDSLRSVDLGSRVTDRRIFALAALPDGAMLMGTREGVVHHDGRSVRSVLRTPDGLPGDVALALLADGTGGAWIGTDHGIARWQNGRVTRIATPAAVRNIFVVSLALDAQGRLWIGGRSGGVVVYDGVAATVLGPAEGLTSETVWSIAPGPDGEMWIGSNGEGVYRVGADLRRIRRLTQADGLTDNSIWQVQPDAHGGMWLYTNRGIDRVSQDGIQHYGRGRGLLELEGAANASWRDANGELWFGTSIGLVRYTPALDVPASVRPAVYIEDLTVDADTLPLRDTRLRSGSGVLKIRYASPTFRDESDVRYRYRLLPVSAAWSQPTAERGIGYAGLGPGHYTFEVRAMLGDGGMSEQPARIVFTVLPRFRETWWFRAVGLVLILAIGGALGLVRTRALQAERRRLESVVAERTGELSAKNTDLEREIVERQRAEEALRSSQQRLLEVVEYSTNMFYSHDADGTITYVSPQSRRILGCEPDVALRRYHEFVTDNPINELGIAATQRALATGMQQPPYQLELRGLDGVVRWVEINEAPVTRDGGTYGIVGSITDITETRRAADEHERLQAQLRQAQKMEAVGRLAGGIAHDFNNLLTAVVGHTELVASGLDSADPLQAELVEVRSAADRAASLVSQLLAFSRQQLVRRRVLDLDTIVTDSARMLRRMIGTDVDLALELGSAPLLIEADRAQLDQVLINLALNARDAMPDGGRLIIETGTTELDDETIRKLDQNVHAGSYVTLRVTDTGHGMDAETVRHVFEPFFTTKEVGKGTGLGLATVYGIITQNGGAVQIDSSSAGTTFRIFLPRVSHPAAEAVAENRDTPAVDSTADQQRYVILVVEDEDAVRRLVCRTLERCGHEVLQAADGACALELCAQRDAPIDLLLTDMVMPGMNGREVAEHVSALYPDIRILYMSGHTRDVLGSRFMLDDATQVVQKPFAPTDLMQHVRQTLDRHAARCV